MLVLTILCAATIGMIVGLLGGGGSILTVPLLVYGIGMAPSSAIATSLLVVGTTSAAALAAHAAAGRVRWGTGLLFAPAGMAGAFLGGRLGSALPDAVVMTLFGLMLAASAWGMLRGRDRARPAAKVPPPLATVIVLGAAVGMITGVVGAGGGFVIVPALVCVVGLPMHAAVGTSLLVITTNSIAGLAGRLGTAEIDWSLALAVTGVAVAGSLVGARLAGRVPQDRLRRIFGWMVVAIAALVLVEQVI